MDLYEPRKRTDPVEHPAVTAEEVFGLNRTTLLASDALVHLAHIPSTGSGLDLAFAWNAEIPIVLIAPYSAKSSRMLVGMPTELLVLRFKDVDELRAQFAEVIRELGAKAESRNSGT